jgi:hypothetical protein
MVFGGEVSGILRADAGPEEAGGWGGDVETNGSGATGGGFWGDGDDADSV